MAKSKQNPVEPQPPAPATWSVRVRAVASVLIALHLAAVILAACTIIPPQSELLMALSTPLRPYINAADLNHGYRFFAPDPGPSHLVRYHLAWADGRQRDGVFPNLNEERPRLLYHRYFMLSEHLYSFYEDWQMLEDATRPDPADKQHSDARPKPPPDLVQHAKAAFDAFCKSYADELLRRSGADSVRLELVEHRLPTSQEVTAGRRLDNKAFYDSEDLGTFRREAL